MLTRCKNGDDWRKGALKMDDRKMQDPKLIFELNSNAADGAVTV